MGSKRELRLGILFLLVSSRHFNAEALASALLACFERQ